VAISDQNTTFALQTEFAMTRTPRNDPCPNGSGKKFRQCCIEIDGVETSGGNAGGVSISEAMETAQAHHDAGQLRQAEAIYRQVLQVSPSHPDALHLLGMIAYQVGSNEIAVELLNKAVQTRPTDPEFYHDLGNVLQAQGRLDDALACFRKALSFKPDHVDAHFNLGVVLHAQGKLDEAVASYRNALSLDPKLADAHNNLGTVFQQQGKLNDAVESYRMALSFNANSSDSYYNLGNALKDQGKLDEGVENYRKALTIRPDHALAHNNLGTVLQRQGRLDEAAESYRRALSLKPDCADAHCNLGSALWGLRELDEAIASYRTALLFRPDHSLAHNDLGNVLAEQGKLDEAAASYRRALSFRPEFAEAHNNLGHVERSRGNLNEAVASFLAALSIKPAFAKAHNNLGNVFNELGRLDAAIASYRRALELEEAPEFKTSFVRCIRNVDFVRVDADVRRLVTRALSEPWARPSDLAGAGMRLITLDREIKGCIERASYAWPARLTRHELFGLGGLQALSNDPLLPILLENAQVCELALERLFTMVRHAMLDAAMETVVGGDPDERTLTFYCAVARQCFLNEFVYSCTADELEQAQRLRGTFVDALQSEMALPAIWVAVVAAYFPLLSLTSAETLPHRSWPESVAAVLRQQITEPLEEQNYRKGMRQLTTVEDSVSRRVQQQYEENPYPRWIKLPPAGKTHSLDSYLREQFPYVPFAPLGRDGDLDILVAGCGTGQESIEMAQQFPAARVLAVDLSLSSLAYAKRKTHERGLSNLEYAQGDITKLGSIGRTFDIISSVGVLHHLEDPMVGWRQLLSLLRPGGFMLLGFYSERARQNIVAAREFIAEQGYGTNVQDIRQCREALTSGENARKFGQLTSFRDFYVTSEIRDLLFHIQEHRFTLPQIKARIAELGLDFVGFLLEPHVISKYKERFPEDKSRTNLDNWNVFEAEFPDTFISTYAFWVQRPAASLVPARTA
jgi:tetratricopeptide (TPR) repeat protein/SAM-dependent methyltransferase